MRAEGGGGGLRGLCQWVHLCTWSTNKLWRSNSIFSLWGKPMVVIFMNNLYFTAIFGLDFYVLYSTVLHLLRPSDSTLCRKNAGIEPMGLLRPERRHGSTRVPGHAFLACLSSWRMVVHIYYITADAKFHQLAAGQLLSGQPVQYGKGWQYGPSITYKTTPALQGHSPQPGGPPCWASPLAFGLIGCYLRLWHWQSDAPITRNRFHPIWTISWNFKLFFTWVL